jgi:Icc protein
MTDFPLTAAPGEPAETSRAIRILHITDFHLLAEGGQTMLGVDTEQSFSDVLEASRKSGPRPDLALLTGDLVQDPCESSYLRLKKRLEGLECPCYCLPGNHDDPRLMAGILAGDHVYCQPRILLDRWQIICLDSVIPHQPCGLLAEKQLDFLKTRLDEQPERFALIAMHHHPISSGSLWMDTMVLQNADRFFAILRERPQARGVVFGHVHQAMDVAAQGLRLLATPSTCFQFKPRQAGFELDAVPPGYRWIELHPDGSIETALERLTAVPAGLDLASHGY